MQRSKENLISTYTAKWNTCFEKSNYVVGSIKGAISPTKIRWRGLTINNVRLRIFQEITKENVFEKIQTQKESISTLRIFIQHIHKSKRHYDRQQKSGNFVARTKEIEKAAWKVRRYFGSDHCRFCTLPFF